MASGSSPTGAKAAEVATGAWLRSKSSSLLAQIALPVSLGIAAAALHTYARMRLGIPGHSAILWLVPLLVARCLAPTTASGTVSSTSAALGMYCFRGLSLRWPLVLAFGTFWLVGPVLDLCMLFFDRLARGSDEAVPGLTRLLALVFVPVAGVVGNLAHLALKFGFGVIRPHVPRFGLAPVWFELATYTVFGLAAGIVACALAWPFLGRRRGEDGEAHVPETPAQ